MMTWFRAVLLWLLGYIRVQPPPADRVPTKVQKMDAAMSETAGETVHAHEALIYNMSEYSSMPTGALMPIFVGTSAPAAAMAATRVSMKGAGSLVIAWTAVAVALSSASLIPVMAKLMVNSLPKSRRDLRPRSRAIVIDRLICSLRNPGIEDDSCVSSEDLNASWCETVKDSTVSKPVIITELVNTSTPEVGTGVGEAV
jgi:hypothetical protein